MRRADSRVLMAARSDPTKTGSALNAATHDAESHGYSQSSLFMPIVRAILIDRGRACLTHSWVEEGDCVSPAVERVVHVAMTAVRSIRTDSKTSLVLNGVANETRQLNHQHLAAVGAIGVCELE